MHVNTALPDDGLVPIGWVAVGDPARILPPSAHDEIWEIQRELDFPGTVFGLPGRRPSWPPTRPTATQSGSEHTGQIARSARTRSADHGKARSHSGRLHRELRGRAGAQHARGAMVYPLPRPDGTRENNRALGDTRRVPHPAASTGNGGVTA
jgi:hypothetical protein